MNDCTGKFVLIVHLENGANSDEVKAAIQRIKGVENVAGDYALPLGGYHREVDEDDGSGYLYMRNKMRDRREYDEEEA